MVTVLEFQGIRCSPRNFQIDIEIKQMMVIRSLPLFEKCVFATNKKQSAQETTNVLHHSTHHNDNPGVEETTQLNDSVDVNMVPLNDGYDINLTSEDSNIVIEPASINIDVANEDNPLIHTNMENREFDSTTDTDSMTHLEEIQKNNNDGLEEVEFNLDELPQENYVQLKKRDTVYYDMYKEAKRKAKMARDLAISSYLEAQNIKQTYMLNDIEDSDSDLDEDDFDNMNVF